MPSSPDCCTMRQFGIASDWMTRLSTQFCLYVRTLDPLWESKQCFLVLFTVLTSTAFTKCGQASIVFKDYFKCFRSLEKGFSEKTSCESKRLFANHRAIRTHDSSDHCTFLYLSPFRTAFFDKRKHYANHLSG